MSHKDTAFYRGNKQINFDFLAEEISSDGAVLLLDKLEREHKLIDHFSKVIPDLRDSSRITHSINKLLKQRVYGIMLGYEDANDVDYLKNDPLLQDVLEGELASQPTISRFENTMNRAAEDQRPQPGAGRGAGGDRGGYEGRGPGDRLQRQLPARRPVRAARRARGDPAARRQLLGPGARGRQREVPPRGDAATAVTRMLFHVEPKRPAWSGRFAPRRLYPGGLACR